MWRVIGDMVAVLVATWFFAATFEPLRSRTFKRPFTPRMIVIGRVLAAICVIGSLVVLCTDFIPNSTCELARGTAVPAAPPDN